MKQTLSLLLCLLLLSLSVLTVGCGRGGEKDPLSSPVTVVADGASDYTVVVSNTASYEYDVAEGLVAAIRQATGVTLPIVKDRYERTGKEILVGQTNRPEQENIDYGFLGENDYALLLEGDTLILCGNSRAALAVALERFVATYIRSADQTVIAHEDQNYTYIGEYFAFIEKQLTAYRIVVPSNDKKVYEMAEELQRMLLDRFGCRIDIYKDFSSPVDKEILLGQTKRDESSIALAELDRERDYCISMINEKLVINGGSNISLQAAYDTFVNRFLKSHEKGTETIYIDAKLKIGYDHAYSPAEDLIDSITNRTDEAAKPLDFTVSEVYRPSEGGFYNNMSGLVECNGKLYIFWVTADEHEDQAGQYVLCAVSDDGKTWSDPITVKGVTMGQHSEMVMWAYPYSYGGKLYCGISMFEYHPEDLDENGRGDWEDVLSKEWILLGSEDGYHWSSTSTPSGYVDYLYIARNSQNFAELAKQGATYFSEGSMYRTEDALVALFRSVIYPGEADDGGMNYKWGCVSYDNGVTWSKAYRTHLSDAPQMSTSGNLPDGRVFYIGSPASDYERACLMLYISEDGVHFDEQYVIYEGMKEEIIKEGIAKNPGYHYPRAVVTDEAIYVGFTLYKETVQVITIPLSSISAK